MSGITVSLAGTPVSLQDVRAWEFRRAGAVIGTLQRKLRVEHRVPAAATLDGRRAQITELRSLIDRDDVRRLWRREIAFSAATTRLSLMLSGSKRRIARTDLWVPGIDVAELAAGVDALMLQDIPAHDAINLAACPDHHLLQARGAVLEVIETTGGAPCPAQFFLDYGDEDGLTVPRDPSFSHQSAGTARLASGQRVGGVRHQFKAERGGVLAALAVEFPGGAPGFMVRQHQWHLACEFSNWFAPMAKANA